MTGQYQPLKPDPWALLQTSALADFSPVAVAAFMDDRRSWSARFALPVLRPLMAALMALARLGRMIIPVGDGNSALHAMIVWGVRHICRPASATLILRHIHLGSQILAFLARNLTIDTTTVEDLRPRCVDDLRHDVFLKHDLNVFNFLHAALGRGPVRGALDFQDITDELDLAPERRRWTQFLDLESAVAIYTVMYAVFLTKADFERAAHSLQFDQDFGRLAGEALGHPGLEQRVSNRHPLLPPPTSGTARRVMIHGLETEALHHLLVRARAAA